MNLQSLVGVVLRLMALNFLLQVVRLERLLRKSGVRSLMEFYVPDPEEMVGHDKEEWFNPMEGLGIIEAMIRAAEEQKQKFADYARLRQDLDDFRFVLDRAASLGKRWNLAMDT